MAAARDKMGLTAAECPEVVSLGEIGYADDSAIPILCEACDAVQTLRRAAESTISVYKRCGLTLKLSANKTTALIQWGGRGAVSCWRSLMMGGDALAVCIPTSRRACILTGGHGL